MGKQKRALAVHDISCVGRCSITIALPMLSAAGIDTGVLPTAILSTHTGGFEGYTYRDLTEDIAPIGNHFRSLDLAFDAFYSGFLGSHRQIDLVKDLFLSLKKEGSLIFVDPVMGDNGSLYPVYTPLMAKEMRKLCAVADIIVPNLTEAALLLDEPYQKGPRSKEDVCALLHRLKKIGSKNVVLTGISFEEGKLGAACLDEEENFSFYEREYIPGMFHGTGDVFASAMLAALMNEWSLPKAMSFAVNFTHKSIEYTVENGGETRFGPCFEKVLSYMIREFEL